MYTIRLTITTRRPARFYIRVKDKNIMRRATARDFVFSPSTKESTAGRSVEVMTQEGMSTSENCTDSRLHHPRGACWAHPRDL